MKAKLKKNWLMAGAGMLAGAFALTGVAMLNSGHTKALADETATERALYFVDCGYYATNADGTGDLLTRNGTPGYPSKTRTPFMTTFGLSFGTAEGGLYNSVTDKPYSNILLEKSEAGYSYQTAYADPVTGKHWGFDYVKADGTSNLSNVGHEWRSWQYGVVDIDNTLVYDNKDTPGFQTVRYVEGNQTSNWEGALVYTFEVDDATTPLKLQFGTAGAAKNWGDQWFYINVNGTKSSSRYNSPQRNAQEYVYDGEVKGVEKEGKYYVTVSFGEETEQPFISYILLSTANYSVGYTLVDPIVKNSNDTTVKAYPYHESTAVDVTLGATAMTTVNAAADYSYVTIPVEKNGNTYNVTALVLPENTASDFKTLENTGSGDNMSILSHWSNDEHHGGKDIYLVKGRTVVATMKVDSGSTSKDKGLMMSVSNVDGTKIANFTGGSVYGFDRYNNEKHGTGAWDDWNNGFDSTHFGTRTKSDLLIGLKAGNSSARDEAYKGEIIQVGKATLKEGGVIDYVVETYAGTDTALETVLYKMEYTIIVPGFSGDAYAVKFGFDPTGNAAVESMTLVVPVFDVTFNSQGGSSVDTAVVEYNEKVTKPDDPTKTDCDFGGWFKEAACTTAFDFDTEVITADITLYAKWTSNVEESCSHNMEHHEAVATTCEQAGTLEYWHCTVCNKNFAEQAGTNELDSIAGEAAKGHDYDYEHGVWAWDGYTSATFTATCKNDSTHTDVKTATITSEVTTEATETEAGVRTYTATVTVGDQTYTDTKTESIPATGTGEGPGGEEEPPVETPKKKGCKSSISASLAIVGGMLAAGTAAIVIKKKKNDK